MDNTGYTILTRQAGLLRETQAVAHNIANISTSGYRREKPMFSEFVRALQPGEPSLSMSTLNIRGVDTSQGPLSPTGGTFDFAIEGPGFFMLNTSEGQVLTRAGSFTANAQGELVAPDGAQLLDTGGSPVFVPSDATGINLAADGTLSADGIPLSQIGVFAPENLAAMERRQGVRFAVTGDALPVENPTILQGYVENSNVDPVLEIARMIEVQHAYTLGQQFLDKEDERLKAVLQTLNR